MISKKWFSVTLLKEHIHAEVKHLEGEVIKVEEHIHDWLVKEGVISPTKPDAEEPAAGNVAISTPIAASAATAKPQIAVPSKTAPAAAADQESK